LTIDDVQKRMMEQVKEFHLDERFAVGKEVLGRNIQAGREKASTVFNKLYADMEAFRESQRKKHEEARREAERNGTSIPSPGFMAPDLNGARQTVQSVGSKAGAYIGSWGTWMGEKRKTAWGRSASGSGPNPRKEKENVSLPVRNVRIEKSPEPAPEVVRPRTQESYEENLFDAEAGTGHWSQGNEAKKTEAVRPPPHPSRFHEEIDQPGAVPEAAADKAAQSSKKWQDTVPKKEDASKRVNAVAEAVEAATTTPISP
jgi:hypothetical protein